MRRERACINVIFRPLILAPFWFASFMLFSGGCGNSVIPSTNATNEISLSDPSSHLVSDAGVVVEKVQLFAWWWKRSTVERGFKSSHRPKDEYLEITKWEYDGEGYTTAPHALDFLSEVANRSTSSFEGTFRLTITSRYENYEELYFRDEDDNPTIDQSVFANLPWRDREVVLDEHLNLQPGDVRVLTRKEYSIEGILNGKYLGKPLCAVRIVAEIVDRSDRTVSSKEVILPVLLE